MFNIGGAEVLVIALIALVVVGPEQLPSVLRKAGKYAAQARQMSTGLRQEFMSGVDELDPTKWEDSRGTGEADKPIVPKGYADRVAAGDPDNPFKEKPKSQQMVERTEMAAPTPDEAVAEATAAAEKAEAEARRAMEKARLLRKEAREAKEAAQAAEAAELEAAEELAAIEAGDEPAAIEAAAQPAAIEAADEPAQLEAAPDVSEASEPVE